MKKQTVQKTAKVKIQDTLVFWAAERIKALRNKANLTQAELAEKATLDLSWVAQIETASVTPSITSIHKICKALNMTPAEFYEDSKKTIYKEDDFLTREILAIIKDKPTRDKKLARDLIERFFQGTVIK